MMSEISSAKRWDLTRLHIFQTVAIEGSFTLAAAVLGLPQPSISRQIAKLESECGGRLFLRTGRGVRLSDLGERVLPMMQSILNDAQALSEEVNSTSRVPTGEVRIATLPSLYLTLVVPLFFAIRKRYPGILLHVFEGSAGQIDQWVAAGFVDIGLPYRYGRHLPADVHPLVTVPSCLVGPFGDKLTTANTVKFEQLDNLPLVLPGAPSNVRLLLHQLAKQAGIRLNVVLEADSTQLQASITRQGGGYTVLPPHAVAQDLDAGRLQVARIVSPEIDRTIVLALTTAKPATLAIREVTRHIRQMMSEKKMIDLLRGTDPRDQHTHELPVGPE